MNKQNTTSIETTLVHLSNTKKVIWCTLGFMLSIIPPFIAFFFFYSFFFEHETYMCLKKLFNFLETNTIPNAKVYMDKKIYVFKFDNNYSIILWSHDNSFSLHHNIECLISSFTIMGFPTKHYCNKIIKLLNAKIQQSCVHEIKRKKK